MARLNAPHVARVRTRAGLDQTSASRVPRAISASMAPDIAIRADRAAFPTAAETVSTARRVTSPPATRTSSARYRLHVHNPDN
jgi:hypothetical protein